MESSASFGYWLRRRRKALDLTQAELARRVGCAESTIRKIEADERRPSKQLAELLADLLALEGAERASFLQAARAELRADRLALGTAPLDQPSAAPPIGTVTFNSPQRPLMQAANCSSRPTLLRGLVQNTT